MAYKWIRVDEETHSNVADVASILNLSRQAENANMGDAVRIAIKEWLERNRVLYLKQAAERNAAMVDPATG